jgi:hypothetical protein
MLKLIASKLYVSASTDFEKVLVEIMFKYVKKNFKGNNYSREELVQAIEKTFHIAKAELRNKIDKIKTDLGESYVSKSKKVPAKVKQLVDGILSKLKHQMLSNVDNVIASKDDIGYRRYYGSVWEAFELQDVFDEYNEKITESSIIEQADSSALRSWMIECLSKMKELLNYFEYGFEEELSSDNEEDEDE